MDIFGEIVPPKVRRWSGSVILVSKCDEQQLRELEEQLTTRRNTTIAQVSSLLRTVLLAMLKSVYLASCNIYKYYLTLRRIDKSNGMVPDAKLTFSTRLCSRA